MLGGSRNQTRTLGGRMPTPPPWFAMAACRGDQIATRTERCAYCLRATIVVTVEQLLSQRGDVVASTVLEKAPCTRTDCIGSRTPPR